MPAKKEKPTEKLAEKPKKQAEPSGLEARVVALEEKIAKYASLDRRITENANAIGRVRNNIGAIHR